MLDSPHHRLGGILLLGAVLVGSCLWYGALAPAPALGVYPGTDDVLDGADRYHGERVAVGGTVVETRPLTIELESDAGESRRLTVTDHDVDPAVGDRVSVYGTLQSDGTIRASNAITYPISGLWYAWSVSFLAGLWVLGRIVRQWEFDAGRYGLRPRDAVTSGGDPDVESDRIGGEDGA